MSLKSVVYYLLLNGFWDFSPLILLTSKLWFESRFANSGLDGFVSEPMWRPGSTNHIFLDHNAAEIISSSM